MTLRSLLSTALVSVSLVAPLPAFSASEAPATPAPQQSLPAITVTPVVTEVLRDRVIASGTVSPVETVYVQPQIEGQAIENILAEVGDHVKQGQVLAELSQSALTLQKSQLAASRAAAVAAIAQTQAQITEAQANRDEANRNLDRVRKLNEQGNAAQAALDQAVASAATADARVNAATQALASAEAQIDLIDAQIADVELNLGRTHISAPVDGVVVQRSARIGAIASAAGASPMFTLIRDGALELRADVPEADLLRLAPGQTASLRFNGLATPISGTVRLVEPSVDAQTRLGKVRIALDDSDTVRDGMFAEATILVTERETLSLPVTAVASDSTVLRVNNGVVERTPVTTGIRDGGKIEIVSGLSAGDLVVARAGAFVRDGDHINPVPAETPVASN